jgi:hypothetical protein
MSLNLAQAAQAVGVNRSTILRACRSGRVSGTRDDSGNWHIEPAELFRVFTPVAEVEASPKAMPQDAQADSLVAMLRETIVDLREQRDRWQAMAERLSLAPPKPESRAWWRFRRSASQ